jgi:hypothetical protein
MKNNILQASVAVLLCGLLLLLSDPFMLFMPPIAVSLVLLGVAALMTFFAVFILYERAQDERELVHRMHSGRIAYLLGIAVLTAAFLMQGIAHAIDPWIAFALAVMVITKVVMHIYLERNK